MAGHNVLLKYDLGRGGDDGGRRKMNGLIRKNSGTVRRRPRAENGGTEGGTRVITGDRRDMGR